MNKIRVLGCRAIQHTMKFAANFVNFNEGNITEGKGCSAKVPEIMEKHGWTKPLLVVDPGVYKLGLTKTLEDALKKANIEYVVDDVVVPNPTFECVRNAVKLYNDNDCDFIIGFGGGSALDTAKGAGALIANPKKSPEQLGGMLKCRHGYKDMIAIPTTAGTGSEATACAVLVNEETRHKFSINDPKIIPSESVLDNGLLEGLPGKIISTTGMDALTHAVESYIGHNGTKKTRAYSEEAVELIHKSIIEFYKNPHNDQARENMQRASYLAGVSFTRGYVGYVHAVAHSLGGKYNVPHGLANSVILPIVLRLFGKSCEKDLAKLADVCGINPNGTTSEKALSFIEWIEEANREMNIPTTLDMIKEEDIPELSKTADKEANPFYPVPLEMDQEELAHIYRLVAGIEK